MNRLKKGDMVVVISGKDKGKKGKVLAVFPDKKQVSVEKIAMLKKHSKPTQHSAGGVLDVNGKLPWSKVMLLTEKGEKATKVAFEISGKKKFRKAKVNGELIGV